MVVCDPEVTVIKRSDEGDDGYVCVLHGGCALSVPIKRLRAIKV